MNEHTSVYLALALLLCASNPMYAEKGRSCDAWIKVGLAGMCGFLGYKTWALNRQVQQLVDARDKEPLVVVPTDAVAHAVEVVNKLEEFCAPDEKTKEVDLDLLQRVIQFFSQNMVNLQKVVGMAEQFETATTSLQATMMRWEDKYEGLLAAMETRQAAIEKSFKTFEKARQLACDAVEGFDGRLKTVETVLGQNVKKDARPRVDKIFAQPAPATDGDKQE